MWSIIGLCACVLSVPLLTLPLTRGGDRPTATVLGYAWRGRKGAVLAAVRILIAEGIARARPRHGDVRREKRRLPVGGDPLVRAVYAALLSPRSVDDLAELSSVAEEVDKVASRATGLRVGRLRRAGGVALAVLAPAACLVGLITGEGLPAIAATAGTAIAAILLVRLNGTTIAGIRALRAARSSHTRRRPTTAKKAALHAVLQTPGIWVYDDSFHSVVGLDRDDHGSGVGVSGSPGFDSSGGYSADGHYGSDSGSHSGGDDGGGGGSDN